MSHKHVFVFSSNGVIWQVFRKDRYNSKIFKYRVVVEEGESEESADEETLRREETEARDSS